MPSGRWPPGVCVPRQAVQRVGAALALRVAQRSAPVGLCGSLLSRRDGGVWDRGCAATAARRHVHERPFQELPEDVSEGEAYGVARDALLQLNIMLRRGIEPDVLMYTSLIATMGRAGLEWQAYKLFSRMIEQNIRPLPETYVALRDATSKQRVALREQIQTKIEEVVDVFPEELAEVERERQREEDRRCIAKFDEYMRGVLPATASSAAVTPPPASSSASSADDAAPSGHGAEAPSSATERNAASADGTIATMHIRGPTDAWTATQLAQKMRSSARVTATGDTAAELRVSLERMDEEELRIYLAAQRQLRHGTKAELIERILKAVSVTAIRAMLDRRAHYFRSVEQILAADLRQLRASAPTESSVGPGAHAGGRAAASVDRTLAGPEKDALAPEVLHAPWGILRKPQRRRSAAAASAAPSPRAAERLDRIRLSEPELRLTRQKAEMNDLDELPESLLRRYAYQFQLRWRRKDGAASLLQAVQWHVTTYVAAAPQGAASDGTLASPSPTPAIRLQKEAEGMQETLENFEAFRVIAQRTNNLQVVDSKEINQHLQRVRLDAVRRERKLENALRRERHVMEAAGLAAAARSFTPPPAEDGGDTRVLGVTTGSASTALVEAHNSSSSSSSGDDSGAAPINELPPWALFEEEDEFNISSGRFGSPEMGRFQELSDSRMQVLPSRAAQAQWSVDRQLLPTSLKDIVQEAELEQQRRHDAIEQEYARRLNYTKYRKWDKMISAAQQKRRKQAQASDDEDADAAGPAQPLPAKRRLAQMLRKGSDRRQVSAEMQAKYNRSL
ncbi:hypothetical protein NESM_000536300 [Novymonas esmeraldas]|uniref:SAP domain-containing protein n=1 Tax=Novymonas esmeraldas TaxID=1808958 RepID=A0AAW0EPR5_9TRYP